MDIGDKYYDNSHRYTREMHVWIQISCKFWLIRMNLESKRSGTDSQIEHKTVLVFLTNHHTDRWSASTNELLILRRICSRRPIFNRKPKSSEEPPRENLNVVGNKIEKKLHDMDHEIYVRILTSYIIIQWYMRKRGLWDASGPFFFLPIAKRSSGSITPTEEK
jgi:hypothetical protein